MEKTYTVGSDLFDSQNTYDDIRIHDEILPIVKKNANEKSVIVILIDELDSIQYGLGFLLSLHIRLSVELLPQIHLLPIVFVSYLPIQYYLTYGSFSQILITKGVLFCSPDELESHINNIQKLSIEDYTKDVLELIKIDPAEGSHSIANIWGASVLNSIISKDDYFETEESKNKKKSLYYKYIQAISPSNIKKSISNIHINAIGKKILLIDDEANKGWDEVLKKYFLACSAFDVISETVSSFNDFSNDSKERIIHGDYDLILLDLRLNGPAEEGIYNPQDFSGMKVLKEIKRIINGTQVIMFTASNKAWNLKALLEAGADGYYIKESPEYRFTRSFSQANFETFSKNVEFCFSRGYLRDVWRKIQDLEMRWLTNSNHENMKNAVVNQLYLSYAFISNINNSEPCINKNNKPTNIGKQYAFAFVSLYQVIEIVTSEYFSNNNEELHQWQMVETLYKQEWHQNGDLASNLRSFIQKRNMFIHNDIVKLQEKKGGKFLNHDIYHPDAFVNLFRKLMIFLSFID